MAALKNKKTNPAEDNVHAIQQHNWRVMKPFVKFGIGALSVIGHALFSIVKAVFKLRPDKPGDSGKDKVIKI